MNSDDIDPLLQRLIEAHPLLFRGRAPLAPSYVVAGWYGLLDTLCSDIEAALGPEVCAAFEVRQIKEKFGTLRFYYRLGEREDRHIDIVSTTRRTHLVGRPPKVGGGLDVAESRVRELVVAACSASEFVCETCGAPAQLRDIRGYMVVNCDQHYVEAVARRASEGDV